MTSENLPEPVPAKASRLPTQEPPFTIGDIKRAIPAHCFERNTLRSLGYVAHDLILASILYYLSTFIDTPYVPLYMRYVLWPVYWFCQGAVWTGLWVIAHECGHRAFSENETFGDVVGMILHSALLVPYHPWRISHRKHHSRTNHQTEDEVFIPDTRSEAGKFKPFDEMPSSLSIIAKLLDWFLGIISVPLRLLFITRMLLFGWPAYLTTHVTGRKYGARTNHFEPNAPLFADSERVQVFMSDVVLFSFIGLLIYAGKTMGFLWLTKNYIIPYLWVNLWLVLITHLQHTDVRLPHFRSHEWTWLKGALCTMDRDYGFLNHFHHHIADTHVAHHLFSRMPHYHAEEATRAIKQLLGKYYLEDRVSPGLKGIGEALWSSMTYCRVVEDHGEVLWFKDR